MTELLTSEQLPVGFEYPALFKRVFEQGLVNLEPWHILSGERLRGRRLGLCERFSERDLVPFAVRQDNDDVACWDAKQSLTHVYVIHDYANSGWESKVECRDFSQWFRYAIDEMMDFE